MEKSIFSTKSIFNLPRFFYLLFFSFSFFFLFFFWLFSNSFILTLFRMGHLGAAHGWGRGQKGPFPKICHTYPTIMKLSTVIPYHKKIKKTHKPRDTTLEFCWHWHFFHRKSAIFVISGNTVKGCILMHNF